MKISISKKFVFSICFGAALTSLVGVPDFAVNIVPATSQDIPSMRLARMLEGSRFLKNLFRIFLR